jgi:signal transduction histidine kinase
MLGLFLAVVGLDPVSGFDRYTFGYLELYEGIPYIPAMIGLFGFAEMLADEYTTMTRGKIEDYLRMIQHNSNISVNIVDELLLLSEVRKEDVQRVPLDMGAIVTSVERRLAHVLEEHEAEFTCPDSWPTALGHGPWLEEVWVNYVSNAVKYGGRPPVIELGATELGETVRFWVRDNGPGIRAEDLPRLFNPFTRLDGVRAQGHGLGLSIVRRIMGKLDGRAGVEGAQAPFHGSVFYFELPLASPMGGKPPIDSTV